jgi:transposase InsO family protein
MAGTTPTHAGSYTTIRDLTPARQGDATAAWVVAIHDYIEPFHNTRRRHSALGMLTPTEYEDRYFTTRDVA